MRLKVSVKKALKVIDYLVEEGYKMTRAPYFTTSFADRDAAVDKWFDEASKVLNKVFLDAVPVYRVLKCRKPKENSFPFLYDNKQDVISPEKQLEGALDVLVGYYDYFVTQEKSPVRYLADKAEIWLYDLCCSLVPESNEAELCRYMFNLGIGEWAEMAEIHKAIKGEDYDAKVKDKSVVSNALDGINRKTKEAFDFSLLKKRKSVVALAIPSRFILEQK